MNRRSEREFDSVIENTTSFDRNAPRIKSKIAADVSRVRVEVDILYGVFLCLARAVSTVHVRVDDLVFLEKCLNLACCLAGGSDRVLGCLSNLVHRETNRPQRGLCPLIEVHTERGTAGTEKPAVSPYQPITRRERNAFGRQAGRKCMFTGIVEETGEVVAVTDADGGRRIRVAGSFSDELTTGQSIAVSGCCLTVEDHDDDSFELFLSRETTERTYLGTIEAGDDVNLERALSANGRFDGHVMQGHIDATAEVARIERIGDDWTFEFSLPSDLDQYVVEKGSIAVDGISLTVTDNQDEDRTATETESQTFSTAIIPTTYELTNLSEKQVGDPVHLEVDILAKYVEGMLSNHETARDRLNPANPGPTP